MSTMRRLLATTAFVTLTGCGSAGHDTPRAVAKALTEALSRGDVPAGRSLYPRPATLKEALNCQRPTRLPQRLKDERAALTNRFTALNILAPTLDEFTAVTKTPLGAIMPLKDCAPKAPINVAQADVRWGIKQGGGSATQRRTLRFIELDARWYLLSF